MGLNIKNERVHALARQAAAATGRTQTGAIELALEELLRRHGLDPDEARIRVTIEHAQRIVADYTGNTTQTNAEVRTVADLFDATTGLPH